MGLIKVHKDRQADTWYWSCHIPMCVQHGWEMGYPLAVKSALKHVNQHGRMGFGNRK